MENIDGSRQPVPGKHCSSNNISADLQNSLFNFFVLIMEPLLLKINAYIQVEVDANPLLLDFHALLKYARQSLCENRRHIWRSLS